VRRNRRVRDQIEAALGPGIIEDIIEWNDQTLDLVGPNWVDDEEEARVQAAVLSELASDLHDLGY